MDIVYLITDNSSGKKYIGSKKNWKGEGTYFGSPSCSKTHHKYDEQQKWIANILTNKEVFDFSILEEFEKIEQAVLLEREKFWQKTYNAINSEDFINAGYAGKSTWYGGDSFKGKTYEEIYGVNAEKEKNKRSKLGVERSELIKQKISDSLKGLQPWNKGLHKTDPRVISYLEKTRRIPCKKYILVINEEEKEIIGKQALIKFINDFNSSIKRSERVNIDKLLSSKFDKSITLKS